MYNMVNTDVICPNCGEGHMIREEPKIIKSNTETFAYLCPICGFVHTAKSDEDMMGWIKSLDKPIKDEILKEQVYRGEKMTIKFDQVTDCLNIESNLYGSIGNRLREIFNKGYKAGFEEGKRAAIEAVVEHITCEIKEECDLESCRYEAQTMPIKKNMTGSKSERIEYTEAEMVIRDNERNR